MRRLRVGGLVAALGLVVLAVAVWTPLASADAKCLVTNSDTGTTYTDLQDAVDNNLSNPSTLVVKGTCVGNTTISGYFRFGLTLTIEGQGGAATLDGGGNGSVLTVGSGVVLTVENLTITDGTASTGGGIDNEGFSTSTVNLINSSVDGNTAGGSGGGIYNASYGTVTLTNSSVNANTGALGAGGISNQSDGRVYLYGSSSVNGNTVAEHGSGGGISNFGTLYLYDSSSVNGNTAFVGGGIANGGTVILGDEGSVVGNKAFIGGGITNDGTVDYCDSTSTAHNPWTGAISPNKPDDPPTPTGTSCS